MPRNSSSPVQISSTTAAASTTTCVDDHRHKSGRRSSRIKQQQHRIPPRHHRSAFEDSSSNLSAMKIFNRFRKLLVRLLFSVGGKKGSDNYQAAAAGERADPPKTSCSSYYSTQLHYSEAIADCIEFLNKAAAGSPDGSSGSTDHGPQPDVWV